MITYCTNIHPGESWDEVFLNLQIHLLEVKKNVSPDDPFPVGLRLSNQASTQLNEKAVHQFNDWCEEHGCYIPTLNGFPYGSFHSSAVKENVYTPDWRFQERIDYTNRLAVLLDGWLPSGMTGSLSTVPVGFNGHVSKEDYTMVRANLLSVLEHLDRLRQKSGKEIVLSLEPEPGCILETARDVVDFFDRMDFPEMLRNSIGVCFDCCHQAVEFEKPEESFSLLEKAGIKVGKIQVSSALRLKDADPEILGNFCEPCYLHQAVIQKNDGSLSHYNDISDALARHTMKAHEEWRIHFHVPVFIEKLDKYETTRFFIENVLSLMGRKVLLEIETYTWHVLPRELQFYSVTDSIIREILWVRSQLNEKNSRR